MYLKTFSEDKKFACYFLFILLKTGHESAKTGHESAVISPTEHYIKSKKIFRVTRPNVYKGAWLEPHPSTADLAFFSRASHIKVFLFVIRHWSLKLKHSCMFLSSCTVVQILFFSPGHYIVPFQCISYENTVSVHASSFFVSPRQGWEFKRIVKQKLRQQWPSTVRKL